MPSQQDGRQRPAGIRDVARVAGVSVATASFALNGRPGVAEDTRKRIVAVAADLGYRANTQAQALRRGQTTTYGIVVRNFANPSFLEVLSGAEEIASETLASSSADESGPLTGTVIAVTFLGATSRITVDLGDTTILAQLPTSDATALSAGSRVTLAIRPDPVLVSAAEPAASEG